MTKQRLSNRALNEQFKPSNSATHHKLLTLDQIMPYDRNPRRTLNPLYDDIKLAIRAAGRLNNPLSVTRRPGSNLYMVESGGNTRLQILKELWQETNDETFYRTDCLIVPWQSESHVLSAHLIENELRGDMTLIDKALAVKDLKAQLEAESGQTLSRNEFLRQLTRTGYPVSKRQLIRFEYAADFLEPLIPMALDGGFGNDKVDRLRKIQASYTKCLAELGGTQAFEPMLAQALAHHDDDELDIDALQRTLDDYIVSCTGQALNRVRMHVDTLLMDNNDDKESWDERFAQLHPIDNRPINQGLSIVQAVKPDSIMVDQDSPEPASEPVLQRNSDRQSIHLNEPSITDNPPAVTEAPLKLSDLPLLRQQCFDLVQQLDTVIPLHGTVKPWEQGYGFYVDLPEQAIQKEMTYLVYWLLIGLSGQNLSSERILLAREKRFAQFILAEQEVEACGIIGSPAPLDLFASNVLLAKQLPEAVFGILLQLIQLCRRINLTYRESDIFECMTIEQTKLRDIMARHAGQHNENTDGDDDE